MGTEALSDNCLYPYPYPVSIVFKEYQPKAQPKHKLFLQSLWIPANIFYLNIVSKLRYRNNVYTAQYKCFQCAYTLVSGQLINLNVKSLIQTLDIIYLIDREASQAIWLTYTMLPPKIDIQICNIIRLLCLQYGAIHK